MHYKALFAGALLAASGFASAQAPQLEPGTVPLTSGMQLVRVSKGCPPGGGEGANLAVATAPPGFDFSNAAATRRLVDELRYKAPMFDNCGLAITAVLLANGANVSSCLKDVMVFRPRGLAGKTEIFCVKPDKSPHAFLTLDNNNRNAPIEYYWNTVTSPAEAAAAARDGEQRRLAAERAAAAAQARQQQEKLAAQAAADARIPVSGSGPFPAAALKRVCGKAIMGALITGSGMEQLNRIEYLPQIKGKDVNQFLPPAADVIPTQLYIKRYGERDQVRVKLLLVKDPFGDWNCS